MKDKESSRKDRNELVVVELLSRGGNAVRLEDFTLVIGPQGYIYILPSALFNEINAISEMHTYW